MTIGISLNNRTFVGMSTLNIVRLSDGTVFNFPTPKSFALTPNIQQKVQTGRNNLGQAARLRSYAVGAFPELVIGYDDIRPELISFLVGKQLVAGSYQAVLPKTLLVTQNFYPAAAVGFLGKGIIADVPSEASNILLNQSTPLTQVNFPTGDSPTAPTGPNEFAVGADGALAFSDDLVNSVITLAIPYTVTGNAWTDLLIGDLSVSAAMVDTENQVTLFSAPLATTNLEGGQLNPSADGIEIKLFLNTPPGSCTAYNIFETAYKVNC